MAVGQLYGIGGAEAIARTQLGYSICQIHRQRHPLELRIGAGEVVFGEEFEPGAMFNLWRKNRVSEQSMSEDALGKEV